jgi:hypothetical protein
MGCRVSSDHGEERESVVRMDAARVDLIEGSNGAPLQDIRSPCVHQHFPYSDLMRLILAPATQPSISLPSGRKGAPGGPSYFL